MVDGGAERVLDSDSDTDTAYERQRSPSNEPSGSDDFSRAKANAR